MTSLVDIEARTKAFSEARGKLVDIVTSLNDGIEALKRQHMPALKRAVATTAQRHDELKAIIEESDKLFVKPRTVIFHGVKVGFTKQKGSISIADEEKTILLIRKHLGDQADVLIASKETVSKAALANVAVSDLKRIGCNVVADTDAVVIKPTDSDVDKLVNALLKDATEEVVA